MGDKAMSETSEITRPLIDALNETGGMALRMNSGTIRMVGRTIKMHDKGTADILFFPCALCWSGRGSLKPAQPIWIETKAGKNGQEPKQREFQLKVETLGHRYILASSVSQGLDEALR
jgi:hypothetical protein